MSKTYFKIFRNNKYIFFSGITERIFFFIIFLLIARKYPVEIYGELITIFSLANIFIILFDLGLPVLLQREVSLSGTKSSGLFSNIFTFNLAVFPFYFISAFIFYFFFLESVSVFLFVNIVIMVYLFSLSNLLNRALSGFSDFKSQFSTLAISRITILILFLPSIYFFNTGLNWLLFTMLAGALIQIVLLLRKLENNDLKFSLSEFGFNNIKSLIKPALPLGLAVVFNFLYDKIDIILIYKLTDFNNAAFYNVGYGIFKTSTIAFSFLFLTGLTQISFIGRNKNAVRLFFKKYSLVLFYICIPLMLVLFFGAEFIINTDLY